MLKAEERDRIRVVLVRTRNPLNIGAAARAMTNFGFRHLRVVEPYDVAFREARSAVDAEPVLQAAETFQDVAGAVADCGLVVGTMEGSGRRTEESLEPLKAVAAAVREQLRSGTPVAVLFGSEKRGLSNEDLGHCQRVLRIPTEAEQPSMNLGQAVAVVLYELIRREGAEVPQEPAIETPLATAEDRERMVELLVEVLERSEAVEEGGPAVLEKRVRRLVRRMNLTKRDAREWMGLVRQVLWKLRGGTDPE